MNRKERKNKKNDNNLIKKLYSIIVKYLPNLLTIFDIYLILGIKVYNLYNEKYLYY